MAGAVLLETGAFVVEELENKIFILKYFCNLLYYLGLAEETLVVLIGGVGGPLLAEVLGTAPLDTGSGFLATVLAAAAVDVVLTGADTLGAGVLNECECEE